MLKKAVITTVPLTGGGGSFTLVLQIFARDVLVLTSELWNGLKARRSNPSAGGRNKYVNGNGMLRWSASFRTDGT
jgi:hypothetical protein